MFTRAGHFGSVDTVVAGLARDGDEVECRNLADDAFSLSAQKRNNGRSFLRPWGLAVLHRDTELAFGVVMRLEEVHASGSPPRGKFLSSNVAGVVGLA